MEYTKQFIEDAIEGGWRIFALSDEAVDVVETGTWPMIHGTAPSGVTKLWPLASALLDPLAWKAVGRTRGWFDGKNDIWEGELKTYNNFGEAKQTVYKRYEPYLFKWHTFIDALAEGKSIEQSLEQIT